MTTREHVILRKAAKIISDFFVQRGGFNNGYSTWASGTVERNVSSRIKWDTPGRLDLTIRASKALGSDLYDQLLDLLEEEEYEGALVVSVRRTESAIYETYVNFEPEKVRVLMPY